MTSVEQESVSSFGFDDTPQAPQSPESPKAGSVLDRIKAVTVTTLQAKTTTLPVPARPGMGVAYSVYLAQEEWDLLVEQNSGDDLATRCAILVRQCRGVTEGGTVVDEGSGPLTFQSQALKDTLAASDAFDAARKFYVRDPDLLRAASAVIRACGWDLSEPLDPTEA